MSLDCPSNKKLRVLCLHGYNTNSTVMHYQSRSFRQRYEHLIDFDFIDAPNHCWIEPIQALLDKGFEPPFKGWYNVGNKFHIAETDDPSTNVTPTISYGAEASVKYIAEHIRNSLRYDGIMGFSQGAVMARFFMHMITKHDRDSYSYIVNKLPKFMISVSGQLYDTQKFLYKDQEVSITDAEYNMASVHIYGSKDEYRHYFKAH